MTGGASRRWRAPRNTVLRLEPMGNLTLSHVYRAFNALWQRTIAMASSHSSLQEAGKSVVLAIDEDSDDMDQHLDPREGRCPPASVNTMIDQTSCTPAMVSCVRRQHRTETYVHIMCVEYNSCRE
jgi:hypothetical protein